MEQISFNLLNDPWIPCKMKSNEIKMLCIKDTLFNASEIFDISNDNPLIVVSLYRLLLAILHRNFGPKDKNSWIKIFKEGEWDKKVLQNYFQQWHHRFELFNEPENRFYQIELSKGFKPTPISKIYHALSSGNNPALFDHNWDSEIIPIKIEDAIQLLIAYQNYALGGGKSTPFNYSHGNLVKGIAILLKGTNLFESLMLNFIRYDKDHPFKRIEGEKDIPFWERENKDLFNDKKGRIPYGYLDYLTWQSRRIYLRPFQENGILNVKEIFISQGEKLKDDWNSDPQMIMKLDKENNLNPIRISPNRQVWREVEALIRLNLPEKFKAPTSVEWISNFISIPRSRRFNLEIFGLCNDPKKAAKLISWHRSSIPLPLEFLENQALVNDVKSFIEKTEKIANILNKTLYFIIKNYLFPQAESINPNQNKSIKEMIKNCQIEIKFWNLAESRFYVFLEELAKESSNLKKRLEIIRKDIKIIVKLAQELLSNLKENFKEEPRALKSYIQNVGIFYKQTHEIMSIN